MNSLTNVWKAAYYLAILMMITPIFDLLSQALPLQPGALVWRYGFLGMLANNLLTPFLGFCFAAVAAAALQHRRALRALSVVAMLAAGGLVVCVAVFVLDVLQVGASAPADQVGQFRAGAAIASLKYLASIGGFAFLGILGIRASRAERTGSARSRRSSKEVPLVSTGR